MPGWLTLNTTQEQHWTLPRHPSEITLNPWGHTKRQGTLCLENGSRFKNTAGYFGVAVAP